MFFFFITKIFNTNTLRKVQEENRFAEKKVHFFIRKGKKNSFQSSRLQKIWQYDCRINWLRKVFRCNIVTLVFSSSSKTMTRTSAYWKKVRENLPFIHVTLSVWKSYRREKLNLESSRRGREKEADEKTGDDQTLPLHFLLHWIWCRKISLIRYIEMGALVSAFDKMQTDCDPLKRYLIHAYILIILEI